MNKLSISILILIALLICHLVEEINTGFFAKFPFGQMPVSFFIGVNILIYSICFGAFFLSITANKLAYTLAWIFAIAMIINGILHIFMMILKKGYFPGGITAIILIPAAIYLVFTLCKK